MTVARWELVGGPAEPAREDDERRLVEQARRDSRAFSALYRRHYLALCTYVFRRTGDQDVTEDLVSDVFLTALRTLPRYRYRGIPVRYWLLRIATNAVNRWARRQRRQATVKLEVEQVVDSTGTAGSAHGEAERERAKLALLALAPRYQSVLALHYLEGLAVKEVAAVLGCRVGTVKSRLARARDALRDRLDRRR